MWLQKTAIYRHPVYQAVLRCSIRDPNNTRRKRVIIPDRATAEWLQIILPGSTVRSLGITDKPVKGKAGRPRIHASDSERKKAHRERKKQALLEQQEQLATAHTLVPSFPDGVACATESNLNSCDEIPFKERERVFVPRFHGIIWDHKKATEPTHVIQTLDEPDGFIRYLKRLHKRPIPEKEKNQLISPAFFGPVPGVNKVRGLENVLFARGVWLDFEDGDLSHHEFAKLFPRLQMVVFNSWSSTKDLPRWRAYIPTSQPITAGVYADITGQIVKVVIDNAYRLPKRDDTKPQHKAHGIDLSKLHAASLFYLPCQPKDPSGAFFKHYKSDDRAPIDPKDWIEYSVCQPEPPTTSDAAVSLVTEVDDALCAQHIEEWRTTGVLPGNGDHGMWRLFLGLLGAGLRGQELEMTIRREAQFANSPGDRQRQVDRLLMKSRLPHER